MLKRILLLISIVMGAGIAISACTGQNEVELTLIAENMMLSTEVAGMQATATWAADRLDATAAAMQTDTFRAEQQQAGMQSTLVARGTPVEFVSANLPMPQTQFPTRTPLPGSFGITQPLTSPDAVQPPVFSAQGTPNAPAQPVANSPLSNVVMSSGVDENGCAAAPTAQFSPQTLEIYVVATAASITAGQEIVSRWNYNGQEVIAHSWTPDYSTNNPECIWFFIDQTEVTFGTGSWNVVVEIDGQLAAGPIPFAIAADASNLSAGIAASTESTGAASNAVESTADAALTNLVMASGVGSDGCATGITSQFSSSTAELYVVATASNIPAGTRIIASWELNGQQIASYDWTPDYTISQECIWFFVDQTAFAFTAGSWSVTLTAEGLGVGGQVAFTIVG